MMYQTCFYGHHRVIFTRIAYRIYILFVTSGQAARRGHEVWRFSRKGLKVGQQYGNSNNGALIACCLFVSLCRKVILCDGKGI